MQVSTRHMPAQEGIAKLDDRFDLSLKKKGVQLWDFKWKKKVFAASVEVERQMSNQLLIIAPLTGSQVYSRSNTTRARKKMLVK